MLELIACIAIAFAIGSNDTSNSYGICIGCGVLSLRRAIYLLFILVLIGLVIGGRNVMETVGGNIAEVDERIVTIPLLLASIAIVLANVLKMPVSSHQAVVAGIIGSALALGKSVNTSTVIEIVLSWIISPFGAFVFAVIVYKLLEVLSSKIPMFKLENIIKKLLFISGSIIAFNTGANELATALAPAVHYGILNQIQAGILGAFTLFLGARIVSHRVIETIGKGITALDPFSGFSAQFGAGITVLLFTILGMPVSTTYCIVGAVSGVGLYKGLRSVRIGFLKRIVASWIITPLIALILSYVVTVITLL